MHMNDVMRMIKSCLTLIQLQLLAQAKEASEVALS